MKLLILLCTLPLISLCLHAQVQHEKNICGEIERFIDDSSLEVKLHSPVMRNNKVLPIIFSKFINNDTISYSLFLSTHSDMVVKDGKGVIVLFTDNTVWRRPGKINAYPVNNNCEYNIVINLTEYDVFMFSTKKIARYMLYIFNQEINIAEADNFEIAVNCIKESG